MGYWEIDKNIASIVENKKILFLENDTSITTTAEFLRKYFEGRILAEIYLWSVYDVKFKEISKMIDYADVIVFETTWTFDRAKEIRDYCYSLKNKKIFIECYIDKPTWFKKPETIHDVYAYKCDEYGGEANHEREFFYKLTEVPYWDYKNDFDN